MTKHTFNVGEYQVIAIERRVADGWRAYQAKTRVYGAIGTLSPDLDAEVDRWTETPVTDELRRNDPVEADRIMRGYRRTRRVAVFETKLKLNTVLAELADHIGDSVPDVHSFSVKAGCSCGCSPGFILTSCLEVSGRPVDIWIERKN